MIITFLIGLFPPKWLAGTEIATYYLAEHLAQRGHEVHVITSLDEGLPVESQEKGFYIHRIPKVRIRFPGVFIFWADIIRNIRKISPDIVHAQSLGAAIPALISKKIFKIPYAVWGQGTDVYLPNLVTKLSSRIILKNANAVIALTNDMKRAMQAIYDRDILVVPNGIDLRGYTEKSLIQKAEESETIILFVGRLHPVKGVQYLIQAMQIVHKELPDVKLVLVGHGEEKDYLEILTDRLGLRECVDFVGGVPHEKIPDYMYHADIFILPSLSEGFPVTILEAMACGLPVIATKVGGLPDIIEEGMNGYLVEAKKPDEIADKVLMLMQNDVMRENISANNRKKAEVFTWEKVAATIEEEYLGTIARD